MEHSREDLLAKIKVLEEENYALSEKTEYSFLLNAIAESTDSSEDVNQIVDSVLEKICILKQLPFAALFSLNGREHKLVNYTMLFREGLIPEREFQIPAQVLSVARDEGFLFLESQSFDSYGLGHVKDYVHIRNLLFYHLSPKFFPDAMLVFVDNEEASQLPSMIYLFDQAINYLVERLDKLYYWRELQKLNNELEERVALRTRDLEKANKLKTVFLQNISHEIRTPLNAIVGFSDLLNKPDVSPERIVEFTGIITRSSAQLLAIVNDILDISTIESGQSEPRFEAVNLYQLLNSIDLQFGPLAMQKGLDFELDIKAISNMPEPSTDYIKIQQVIMNLIGNAIKFTEKGKIKLSAEKKSEEVVISVSDSGIGIAPEDHEIIFDRFRQVDQNYVKAYRGTGLGLYICRTFMDLLGGRIWLESELGSGSVFHIALPLSGAESKENIPPEEPFAGGELPSQLKVLLVEDDDTNFMLMEVYLNEMNLQIARAHNGLEAVEMVEKSQYDIVLMDVQLPVMNGLDATRKIRAFNRDIPIIAITAFAFEKERKIALEAGCNEHLSKPVRQEMLEKTISEFIRGAV